MKQTRWILPAAVFVLAACSETGSNPTSPAVASRADLVTYDCGGDCLPTGVNYVLPGKITLGQTQIAGIVLFGSPTFNAANVGGIKIGSVSRTGSDTVPPVPPTPGAFSSFLARAGTHPLNQLLIQAGFVVSDTVPPGPGPGPARERSLFVGDLNGDGLQDVFIAVSIADLQKKAGLSTVTGGLIVSGIISPEKVGIIGPERFSYTVPISSDTVPPAPPGGGKTRG